MRAYLGLLGYYPLFFIFVYIHVLFNILLVRYGNATIRKLSVIKDEAVQKMHYLLSLLPKNW